MSQQQRRDACEPHVPVANWAFSFSDEAFSCWSFQEAASPLGYLQRCQIGNAGEDRCGLLTSFVDTQVQSASVFSLSRGKQTWRAVLQAHLIVPTRLRAAACDSSPSRRLLRQMRYRGHRDTACVRPPHSSRGRTWSWASRDRFQVASGGWTSSTGSPLG
jgi:hypothetical protein